MACLCECSQEEGSVPLAALFHPFLLPAGCVGTGPLARGGRSRDCSVQPHSGSPWKRKSLHPPRDLLKRSRFGPFRAAKLGRAGLLFPLGSSKAQPCSSREPGRGSTWRPRTGSAPYPAPTVRWDPPFALLGRLMLFPQLSNRNSASHLSTCSTDSE